jgi:hypothetical protein
MKFTYELTLSDYQAAQKLHWRQTFFRRALGFSLYWGGPAACCAIALLVGKRLGIFLVGMSSGYVLLLGFALGLLVLLPGRTTRNARRFRRQFERKFRADQRSASFEIDDHGISSAILGTGEVKFEWSTVVGFAQDDKMTLLYLSREQFLLFSTTVLTPTERTELSQLVSRNLAKRQRC